MDIQEIQKNLPSYCQIIAVSKKQSLEQIENLHKKGQLDFAENYSQELIEKQFHFRDTPIRWHFIGAIQKNKLKHIVGHVHLIHSVGSLETAEAIDQLAKKMGVKQKILLQLNLAHEPTKSGWLENQLLQSLEELAQLDSLEIQGLMTLPPLYDDQEQLRPFFRTLRELREAILPHFPSCKELSMGTSSDYQVAVQEGATMIRLGTLIFGPRK